MFLGDKQFYEKIFYINTENDRFTYLCIQYFITLLYKIRENHEAFCIAVFQMTDLFNSKHSIMTYRTHFY